MVIKFIIDVKLRGSISKYSFKNIIIYSDVSNYMINLDFKRETMQYIKQLKIV